MALITKLLEEPTGAYVADLPQILGPIHPVGVESYSNRWLTRDLTQSVGATVSPWTSLGGVNLTANATSNAPLMTVSSGIKALAFDGIDDAIRNSALGSVQRTLILVMRFTAADGANTSVISGSDDDISIVRTAGNQIGVFAPGSASAVSSVTQTGTGWHVIGLRLDATQATAWRDGVRVATAASTGGGLSAIRLPVANGVFGKIEVAEFITYAAALSDAEMLTIRNTLKETYTVLS